MPHSSSEAPEAVKAGFTLQGPSDPLPDFISSCVAPIGIVTKNRGSRNKRRLKVEVVPIGVGSSRVEMSGVMIWISTKRACGPGVQIGLGPSNLLLLRLLLR